MKQTTQSSRKLAALAIVGIAGSAPAMAATTYDGKGGMHTTQQTAQPYTTPIGQPMLARGVQEFGLAGFLNWDDETNYSLAISYGRFVTDNWLLGARLAISGQNSDADYAIGVFAEYNFLTGTAWVPFVGASLDYSRLEGASGGDVDRLRTGLEAGVKYFFRPNIAISASLGGAWNSDTLPDGDDFQKQVNLGLRYYF